MNKIWTMVQKEWADALHNRQVMFTLLLLPVIVVGFPLAMLAFDLTPGFISGIGYGVPPALQTEPPYTELTAHEAQQTFAAQQFNLFLLVVPLAVPMTLATYSIIGEKRERSLEPLLATPISTRQLLTAKALAAAGPGALSAWLSALVYALGLCALVQNPLMRAALLSGSFAISVLLIAPLLTLLATTLGVIISSRVNDPRAAEQGGMLVLLPVVALMLAQIGGVLIFDLTLALLVAGALLAGDLVMFGVMARFFQRETILTRWT